MLTHSGTNTIETERLILRRFRYTDDDVMLKYWVADENIQSLYSEPVYTTNPNAVRRGYKQLNRYVPELERQYGGSWIKILVTYTR